MPNLKDLKIRINSVKSTQKITSAMKMVAAAKLRRAQEQAEAARPYAERMERVLGSLAASMAGIDGAPGLLARPGQARVLVVVGVPRDRGLGGVFSGWLGRGARKFTGALRLAGKKVKIICIGRRGADRRRREFAHDTAANIEDGGKPRLSFDQAEKVA